MPLRKMWLSHLLLLASLIPLLAGCPAILKTKLHMSADTDGVTYYLPKKLLQVTVTRKAVPPDSMKKAALEAEEAKAKADTTQKEIAQTEKAIDDIVKAKQTYQRTTISPDRAVIAKFDAEKTQLDTALADKRNALVRAQAAAQQKLEAYQNQVLIFTGANLFEDDITITELPVIPDTSQVFVTKLNHWWTREDHVVLTTTPAGLLKTITGESVDKTSQILQDTAKLAITLATGVPIPGRERAIMPAPPAVRCPDVPLALFGGAEPQPFPGIRTKTFSNEYIFDPSDYEQVLSTNARLCRLETAFLVNVVSPSPILVHSDPKDELDVSCHCSTDKYADGLVYRRPVPYIVELRERHASPSPRVEEPQGPNAKKTYDAEYWEKIHAKQNDISSVKKSAAFLLPNKGPVSTISTKAGFFTQTKLDIGFDDGMLTKSEITQPSEAHAVIQLPLTIVKDIISVPTELLQLKLNYTSKDTELLKAQEANIEAQHKLDNAIEELKKSRDQGEKESP